MKVNTYPTVRGFTAIGTGGDDFVQAMVVAVESVIQQSIPEALWVVVVCYYHLHLARALLEWRLHGVVQKSYEDVYASFV
ncbi:unnamed protein product [Linum tenue]|uniref:Uncharacterized protein n=1 Tax=Linum tenue TaxID=586396 RepID=A0AAV0S2B8_9ROSI|nr:unnamed protein product [Linum tenue]